MAHTNPRTRNKKVQSSGLRVRIRGDEDGGRGGGGRIMAVGDSARRSEQEDDQKVKELGDGEVQVQERMLNVLRLRREKRRKRRFCGGGGLKGNFTGGGGFERLHGSHGDASNAPPESY